MSCARCHVDLHVDLYVCCFSSRSWFLNVVLSFCLLPFSSRPSAVFPPSSSCLPCSIKAFITEKRMYFAAMTILSTFYYVGFLAILTWVHPTFALATVIYAFVEVSYAWGGVCYTI